METTAKGTQRAPGVEFRLRHQARDQCIHLNSSLRDSTSHLKIWAGINRVLLLDTFLHKDNHSEAQEESLQKTCKECTQATCLLLDILLTISSDHQLALKDRWASQE